MSDVMGSEVGFSLNFIERNVRDLAKTVELLNLQEVRELHSLAFTNLVKHLQPGRPLAEDPSLSLEAFKAINSLEMQMIDSKRKASDTIIKSRALVANPIPPNARGALIEASVEGEEDIEGEAGIFGTLTTQS